MQRVLDLGAGGGGVGIAAKLMGAAHVCVNDIDSTALVAAHLNAELNGAGVDEYCVDSLIGTTSQAGGRGWDVILAGGVCVSGWSSFTSMLRET